MEWAKTRASARFNLATSGLTSAPLTELPVRLEEIEITGTDSYGYAPLQERIAQHTGSPAESVATAAGTSLANHLVLAALLEPGDEVLIEEPVYGPLFDLANYFRVKINRIRRRSENSFALDPDELENALTSATRLVILTNFHNPSGALMPAETLRRIGEIAQQRRVRVLVDEAYLEMLFDTPVPSAFSIGQQFGERKNPFIITNSLTKTFGLSGLRCGWILAEPPLVRQIWLLNDLFGVNAAHPAERMSIVAFDHLNRFRERARTLLETNRALLDSFLDSRADLECFRPPGGTIVFPRLREGEPEGFFKLLRDKYETSVVPGRFFEMPQHFRLGIGGETSELRAGLARLTSALDEFEAH